MVDYAFAPLPAYDPTTSTLLKGATFTFQNSAGTATPIKSLTGVTIVSLTADAVGMVPGFLATDASIGFLVNGAGVKIPVQSTWAQDPAQVATAVANSASAAATSASQAATTVGTLTPAVNSLTGRVTALESAGSTPVGIPGAKMPQEIRAADFGGQWPSPHPRILGDTIYSVTFTGPIAAPPPVSAGSPDGMQPGDYYNYIGT